jgi:two-component system, OmpR family, KDP operon response regulator KdpE
MSNILIVDDDPQLVRALRINLRAHDHDVRAAADGTTALALAAEHHPDLVILDLGLPDLDGVEVVHGLRGWTDIPIIVLSARDTEATKIAALDAGADDYITKPFGMGELHARIRSALRRATPTAERQATTTIGGRTLDLATRTVTGPDGPIHLTPTEWHLLEVLLRHTGKPVQHHTLLNEVWGPGYANQVNYLRVHIANLRRKLEPDPAHPHHLLTEPNYGYRFAP